MDIPTDKLKALILDADLLTESKLNWAEKKAQKVGESLDEFLVKEGLVSENRIAKMRAYLLGIPFINLEKEIIDPAVLRIIPEPIARKHHIVAYNKKEGILEVAMLNPEDLPTIEFIKKKTGLKIHPRLTSQSSIKNALRQYQKSLEAEFGEIIKKEMRILGPPPGPEEEKEVLKKHAEELPIIRIVDTLLKHAVIQSASDIHIEPEEKRVLVRYRIDGILHDAMTLPKKVLPGIVARIKVLANLKLDEHRLPQDGRFKTEFEDHRVSIRVSVMPIYDGEKVVLRLLPEESQGMTLEKLGIRGEALEKIHRALHRPNGLILVTGPTGSGKTTCLYTMMDIINKPDVNICTIEDPIEYRMPRINQTQVRPSIGLTFANGLRALVRQDPDIIMVGEIRDSETASLAIHAALTGHLVLSTLHTNSAAGALPRLLDMEVEAFLLASTINLVIGERLVRTLCPDIRKPYHLSPTEIAYLKKEIDLNRVLRIFKAEKIVPPKATWADVKFYKPGSAKECPDGYKGRMGIFEVLEVTEDIKELILKGAPTDRIHKQALKQGMITMLEDGFIKAAQGLTSLEAILKATRE